MATVWTRCDPPLLHGMSLTYSQSLTYLGMVKRRWHSFYCPFHMRSFQLCFLKGQHFEINWRIPDGNPLVRPTIYLNIDVLDVFVWKEVLTPKVLSLGSIQLKAGWSPNIVFPPQPVPSTLPIRPQGAPAFPTSCVKPAPKGQCELARWVEDLSTWGAPSAKLPLLAVKGQTTFISVSAFFRDKKCLREDLHWAENTTEMHLDGGAY